jgi:outer membrane lipoprotein-sorting protein
MRLLPWLCLAFVSARAETLNEILARMDQASPQFKSYSATMNVQEYTALLDETEKSKGSMRLKRAKSGMTGVIEVSEPDSARMSVYLNGKTAERYFPKANTEEIWDVGKYAHSIDEVILIGFGTSGADLKKQYDVKLGGNEMIGGVKTSRLELVPKDAETRKLATKIELWIPEGQANPVQEKISTPSKNYKIVNFSDVKINPALPDSDYTLKLPAGVKKIYPQK